MSTHPLLEILLDVQAKICAATDFHPVSVILPLHFYEAISFEILGRVVYESCFATHGIAIHCGTVDKPEFVLPPRVLSALNTLSKIVTFKLELVSRMNTHKSENRRPIYKA